VRTDDTRPLAAAQAVARAHGVACDDAVRIAGGSNALIHLRPAPVVARVMTATAILHDDLEQWLTREVAVGRYLAGRNAAVVAPSELLPPGPHEHGGLWMTMWTFVEHDEEAPEPFAVGRSLRDLHAALAGFPGALAPLSGVRDWLEDLLSQLPPSPDNDRLRGRLEALTPTVFESALPTQPLHGDASSSNLLRTKRGLLWNDFEDVCVGPVEWDIAGLVAGASDREALLAGYGEPAIDGLKPFLEAHALYDVIWRAFVRHRV
jgi:Phosphotransferase enzyme family